jgi:GNAT superfamily N-acetyltransferase
VVTLALKDVASVELHRGVSTTRTLWSLLIRWSLDPIAQGPFKRVPNLSTDELRSLFLADPDRSYFVLRRTSDATPLGRFYWKAWRFRGPSDPRVDWELNILLADPRERGKGYGAAAQRLAASYLEARPAFWLRSRRHEMKSRGVPQLPPGVARLGGE